jgi:amino acid transporter
VGGLGTVPDLGSSATPLADGARIFLGEWGGWLLTAGAAISILGTNGGSVLAGPRYLFALARAGFGPRYLASVHPRFRTPAAAVLTQTAIALPLALSGSFVGLATLSVVARLVTYLATATAVPVLRRRHAAAGSFRLPGGLAIPAIATVVSLGLLETPLDQPRRRRGAAGRRDPISPSHQGWRAISAHRSPRAVTFDVLRSVATAGQVVVVRA